MDPTTRTRPTSCSRKRLLAAALLTSVTATAPAQAALVPLVKPPIKVTPPAAPSNAPSTIHYQTVQSSLDLSGVVTRGDVSGVVPPTPTPSPVRVADELAASINIDIPLDGKGPYRMRTGFEFFAGGPVTYGYRASHDFSIVLPNAVYPGMKFIFHPDVGTPRSAQLNGSQNLYYGTNWFFRGDIPFDGRGEQNLQVDLGAGISAAGLTLDLGGNVPLATTSSALTLYPGTGAASARTPATSVPAWGASADIFSVVGQLPIGGVSTTSAVLDLLGFDLDIGVQANVYRSDLFWADNFRFSDLILEVPALAPVGKDLSVDGADLALRYDVGTQSFFDYSVDLTLKFDGPWPIPEVTLLDREITRWAVGNVSGRFEVGADANDWSYGIPIVSEEYFRQHLATSAGTLGAHELGAGSDLWEPLYMFRDATPHPTLAGQHPFVTSPRPLLPVIQDNGTDQTGSWLPETLNNPGPLGPESLGRRPQIADVDLSTAPIPAPSTLALLAVGMLMMRAKRRAGAWS